MHPTHHTSSRVRKQVSSRKAMVGGRLKSVKHASPSIESVVRYHFPCYHSQTLNSVPSGLLGGTSRYQAALDPQCHRIKKLWLQFTIHVDGGISVDLPPTWTWLERVSWRANGGSTALLDTFPSDVLPLKLAAELSFDKSDKMHSLMSSMNAENFATTATNLPPGTHTFYLPVLDLFEDTILEGLAGDITADLYPSGIIPSTVTVTSLQWIVATDRVSQEDRSSQMKALKQAIHSRSVPESIRYEITNRTLSPSTEFAVDLDSFNGHSMALLIYIRDASGNKIDLAAGAECDIESASGRSMFGQGSLVPVDLLQSWGDMFANSFVEQVPSLVIPFTDSLVSAMQHGVRSGCYHFTGERARLILKPGPTFPQASNYSICVYMLRYSRLSRFRDRLSMSSD